MRTPISYYGGKQGMIKYILPKMYSKRNCYIEPFFGGGAVFFAKEQEKNEVINDHNDFVINFYKVMKNDFEALNKRVQETLVAHSEYEKAMTIYKKQENYNDVERAWALWVLSRMCFAGIIGGSFSFSQEYSGKIPHKLQVRKEEFITLQHRLENTTIWDIDAVELIKKYDRAGSFYYLDPPYVNAVQGHYAGYTQEMFNDLLETLANLKGKFLLSSYNNDKLNEYTKQLGWNKWIVDLPNRTTSVSLGTTSKRRYEVLTANYNDDKEFNLF